MWKYVIKRILTLIPVLIGVTLIVYLIMYLGKLIEKAPAEELFTHPTHPYTQALLSAIPIPNIHKKLERILLKGEITSPIEPKPICRFANRCTQAFDRCRCEEPQLKEIAPGHFVSCFLTDK